MPGDALKLSEDDALQAVIDTARSIIVEGRHDQVSLEEIVLAAAAPQSIVGTLIKSKEDLYRMAVFDSTKDIVDAIFSIKRGEDSTEKFLMRFAINYLGRIVQPDAVKAYRLAVSQASRHPSVGEEFKKNAHSGYDQLAKMLEEKTEITLPDGFTYIDAAHQFYALCRGALYHLYVFAGNDEVVEAEAVINTAKKAVATFLRAFPTAD